MLLRPYQATAMDAAARELQARGRALVAMATGTGKTIVFSAMAERFRPAGRALVLAHREELLDQAAEKIHASTLLRAGIEQAERRVREPYPDVVIASVQTLASEARRRTFPPDLFGLVIVDEAHHGTARSYREVLEYFKAKRLGVTATPDRHDGTPLSTVFGSTVFHYPIRRAVREGYLVDIRRVVEVMPEVDLSRVRVRAGDFDAAELETEMMKVQAVQAVAGAVLQRAGARPTVLFCAGVKHSRAVAAAMNALAPGCAASADGEDRAGVAELAAGRVRALANCLDSETEILTRRGWLGIDDFRDDDVVAAPRRTPFLDGQEESRLPPNARIGSNRSLLGEIDWLPVSQVTRRERDGLERMVSIKNQTLNIRVTEGHRMLVRAHGATSWAVQLAEMLPNRVGSYQIPLAAEGLPPVLEASPGVTPPHRLTIDDCRFIGLWIADGTIDHKGSRGASICQSEGYPDRNAEIVRLLTSCGFDWKLSSYRNKGKAFQSKHAQLRYRIPKGSIGGQLARRGFARIEPYLNKDFSALLFGLNRAQAKALVEGLWLGDGVKEPTRTLRGGVRSSWKIVNTNKRMLDRLQSLVVTRGFAANMSPPKKNGPFSTKPIYHIIIRNRAAVTTNNHSIETSGGNPARFEDDWRAERVWCVTNANGTIITRRHGKVAVMGQCDLTTEGFDFPPLACVALVRPTKSLGRATQQVGRGTRLSEGKRDLLVVEFVAGASSGQVTTVDVVGSDFSPRVRGLAEHMLDRSPTMSVLDALDRAAAQAKENAITVAPPRPQRPLIDPMKIVLSLDGMVMEAQRPGRAPATAAQIKMLESEGLRVTGVDIRQAALLSDGIRWRRARGLSSPSQAIRLFEYGFEYDVSASSALRHLATMRSGA